VRIRDLSRPVTFRLGPWAGAAALFDAGGRLVGLEGREVVVGGRSVVSGEATCGLVSLDGKDLAESTELLALPMEQGQWKLEGNRGHLRAEVGEVRGGKWVALESFDDLGDLPTGDPDVARSWIAISSTSAREVGERIAEMVR